MCSVSRRIRAGMVLWLFIVGLAAWADEDAAKGRAILEQNKNAVVTVQMIIKQHYSMEGMGSQSQENKQEITGTVIDPGGLTVLSLTESDPSGFLSDMMDEMPMSEGSRPDFRTEVTDVKMLLEDGTEIPAREVLRDQDLDLAFVRPTDKPEKPMAFVDLTQAGTPEILDRVVALNRLGKVANRAYAASFEHIEAIITKPRMFYVPGSEPTRSGLGCPVFTLDGKAVGILLMRRVKTGGGGGVFGFGGDDSIMAVILPVEDVLEAAKSEETAPKSAAEPSAPETIKPEAAAPPAAPIPADPDQPKPEPAPAAATPAAGGGGV